MRATIGAIRLTDPFPNDLVVTLVASDPSEIIIPASITIPAGSKYAEFDIAGSDELFDDGTRRVTITAFADNMPSTSDTLTVEGDGGLLSYVRSGDDNTYRDQGQIVVDSSLIRDSQLNGIKVESAPRDAGGSNPHSGVNINYTNLPGDRLAPGVVISNNVIADSGQTGISFKGDPNVTIPLANVPFGRIFNNTIVGATTEQTGSANNPVTYDGVTFSAGDISFADLVVDFDPLFGGGPAPTNNPDPNNAIGPPDEQLPGGTGASVSLGSGGRIVLQFVNNFLTGSNTSDPDVHVFESGVFVEDTLVDISKDGITWF